MIGDYYLSGRLDLYEAEIKKRYEELEDIDKDTLMEFDSKLRVILGEGYTKAESKFKELCESGIEFSSFKAELVISDYPEDLEPYMTKEGYLRNGLVLLSYFNGQELQRTDYTETRYDYGVCSGAWYLWIMNSIPWCDLVRLEFRMEIKIYV